MGNLKRICYYEAKEALQELRGEGETDLLAKGSSWANLKSLLRQLLAPRNNLVLFLGAGSTLGITAIDEQNAGNPEFKALSWDGLLKELFLRLDEVKQREFLIDQTLDHSDDISEEDKTCNSVWFEKIRAFRDKPTLAWHLSLYFNQSNGRNEAIYELVAEPLFNRVLVSPILEQAFKLPFNDIVTTNFDWSVEEFLKYENTNRKESRSEIQKVRRYNKEEIDFSVIYDLSSFLNSIASKKEHRLFYIHGKADSNGSNFLVFDKFDFARLIAQRDSVLEYLIGQFLNSTILYIGFGLDDQTFNYIQERLFQIFGSHAAFPTSFSFSTQKSTTEIAAYNSKHINVINYQPGSNHKNLAKILKHLNTIIEYLRQSPENELTVTIPSNVTITRSYMDFGRKSYLSGNLDNSLKNYRLALASLLFSDDVKAKTLGDLPQEIWEYHKLLLEIRRHIALNLSKLRWRNPDFFERTTTSLTITLVQAKKSLAEYKSKYPSNLKNNKSLAFGMRAQEVSLDVLRARISSHDGNIKGSSALYELVQKSLKKEKDFLDRWANALTAMVNGVPYSSFLDGLSAEERQSYEINDDVLLLGASYIFAREQQKRHDTFLNGTISDSEPTYIEQYSVLIRELTKSENLKYFNAEMGINLQELASILVIGLWEVGSRYVRYASRDLLPITQNFEDNINRAIMLFEKDETEFGDAAGIISLGDKQISILPSVRWQTRMYRHRSRAYMLRWYVNGNPEDMLKAFVSFKKALDPSKETLKGEYIKNCLESVRMHLLIMLKGQINPEQSELCRATGVYYLRESLNVVIELLGRTKSNSKSLNDILKICRKGENHHVWWMMIFVLKIASYFNVVLGDLRRSEQDILGELGVQLLGIGRSKVENEYRDYGRDVMKSPTELNKVVVRYGQDMTQLKNSVKQTTNRSNKTPKK